ncbi:hypothetical protein D9M68_646350 [compost metagenome]
MGTIIETRFVLSDLVQAVVGQFALQRATFPERGLGQQVDAVDQRMPGITPCALGLVVCRLGVVARQNGEASNRVQCGVLAIGDLTRNAHGTNVLGQAKAVQFGIPGVVKANRVRQRPEHTWRNLGHTQLGKTPRQFFVEPAVVETGGSLQPVGAPAQVHAKITTIVRLEVVTVGNTEDRGR